ncbi:MAG: hypothetical protein KTQ49_04715 [Candidatus Omnitrophica bacterium]|nr:hypothetical protein [Candidatus Omnitrophota bacterium]
MSQDLLASLEYIEKEKGISKEALLEALRHALLSACRKTYPRRAKFSRSRSILRHTASW